jgi:hypothetical protein
MITIDHAGSRLYKWLFEFNGSLFLGWEPLALAGILIGIGMAVGIWWMRRGL